MDTWPWADVLEALLGLEEVERVARLRQDARDLVVAEYHQMDGKERQRVLSQLQHEGQQGGPPRRPFADAVREHQRLTRLFRSASRGR